MAVLGAYRKDPRKRRPLTPLGNAVLKAAQDKGLTLAATVQEIACGRSSLTRILRKPTHWPLADTRMALAAFIGISEMDVVKLARKGGAGYGRIDRCGRCGREVLRSKGWGGTGRRRPTLCSECYGKRRQVDVSCDYCGAPLKRGKDTAAKYAHHFCNLDHCWAWRRGRKHPGPRPRSGRRTGRHLVATRARLKEPSQAAVADAAGVSLPVVKRIAAGKGKPQEVSRYRLEKVGHLPRQDRSPVAVAILEFCIDADISVRRLAAIAGIERKTLAEIVSGLRTPMSPTLAKLAAAMGRGAAEFEILAGPVRRRPPKRGPGRPATFTRRDALEVRRLRSVDKLSWAAIGRLKGWPVQADRHGRASDCQKARRAYDSLGT